MAFFISGIESKVDYLKENNFTVVWLNPIYASPMNDGGYDISDHTKIGKMFGTMEDFDNLRSTMHRKGLKLVMDFVPNHTSRNHTWFQKSSANDPDYADYYVWHAGIQDTNGEPQPPSNWVRITDLFANTFTYTLK